MTGLYQRILAAIETEEATAKAAALDWSTTGNPPFLAPDMVLLHVDTQAPATTLRRLAEDRDVLARHQREPHLLAHSICRTCRVPTPWPCPEILSLARRHQIDPEGTAA